MSEYTDRELLGTLYGGRCMDCKWPYDSEVNISCGCNGAEYRTAEAIEEHNRILKLAREAQTRTTRT